MKIPRTKCCGDLPAITLAGHWRSDKDRFVNVERGYRCPSCLEFAEIEMVEVFLKEPKTVKLDGLSVSRKDDGFWLVVKPKKGPQAVISFGKLMGGPIVNQSIEAWCNEYDEKEGE